MKYAVSQAGCGKCGCAEKPELRNLIDDSEEVEGRNIRNSNANGKAARRIVVSRGICQRNDRRFPKIKMLRIFTASANYVCCLRIPYIMLLFCNTILYNNIYIKH